MKILTKNRTKYDCGIVAVFNALAWCNTPKTYSKVEKIAKSCGYNPEKGIHLVQFCNLIKKLDIPAKRIVPKSLEEIQNGLYTGKFFVFLYCPTGDDWSHAITAFTDHTGNIRLINSDAERITWNDFASDIHASGMRRFYVYEIPHRGKFLNDNARAS